jgi:hypothetical protein
MLTNEQIAEAAKKYFLEGFLKRHSSPVRAISLSELETECHARGSTHCRFGDRRRTAGRMAVD